MYVYCSFLQLAYFLQNEGGVGGSRDVTGGRGDGGFKKGVIELASRNFACIESLIVHSAILYRINHNIDFTNCT